MPEPASTFESEIVALVRKMMDAAVLDLRQQVKFEVTFQLWSLEEQKAKAREGSQRLDGVCCQKFYDLMAREQCRYRSLPLPRGGASLYGDPVKFCPFCGAPKS